MRNWTKGKRLTAAFLAVALFLSIIPSGVIPVYSEESASQAVDYSQYIGYLAELNFKDHTSFTAAQTPNGASTTLVATDFVNTVKLQIVDCHVDGSALWYQVTAAPGYTLPAKLETYPWILQNTFSVAGTADALILTKPTYSDAAASVLNDKGVTVSGDLVELTALSVQESHFAPVASYISRSASYNISTQTASGYYSGHATVAIPIPAGWDSAKIFGFVVEKDNSVSMIPGTVTEYGTFRFTVPHFSVIGIAEVTDPALVQNVVITFGRIQETNTVTVEKKIGTEGRYTSDDGAIEYVIQHVNSTDPDSAKTKITFKALSVANTNVVIENYTFTVIVNKAEVQVEKLLASGAAASEMLYPLYDLGVTGPYSVTYDVLNSGCVDLNTTNGVISIKSGFARVGNATVIARVTHTVNHETTEVATVTYKVMASGDVAVNDVKHLYVPQGGTVTITRYVGSLVTEDLLDTSIATAETIVDADNAVTGIKVTGVANSGETYFVADSGTQKVLFVVHAEPENTNKSNQCYLWVVIESNTHCTIYYAINGGTLHCLPAGTAYNNATEGQNRVVLVGLDISTVQEIPGNYTITFFGAPDPGYTTAKIGVKDSEGQFYCLSNGILYDGSDSDAWPLDAMGHQKTDKFNKPHGMYNPIYHGHMTEAELRDLYTRALALGCDSVSSFTRLGTDDFRTNISFIAEELPGFKKTITHYKTEDGGWNAYTENVVLKIGDSVRYQFCVDITSEYITYQLTIADPYLTANGGVLTGAGIAIGDLTIGNTVIGNRVIGSTATVLDTRTVTNADGTTTSVDSTVVSNSANYASLTFTNVTETLSFTVEYTLNEMDILLYANGRFTNHATLSYSYDSLAASGSNQAETTASAACRVSSIVTWVDSFGNVINVQEVKQDTVVTHPTILQEYTAYTFDAWYIEGTRLEGKDYQVDDGAENSITIVAQYEAIPYTITYLLGDGASWSQDANVPEKYTYEDIITLPVPVRNGYTFKGWKVSATKEGSLGNWPVGIDCTGEFLLLQMYGDVTLTAVWEAKSYEIKYELGEGKWPENVTPPTSYTVGEKLELPEPVLPGKVFLMWKVFPAGSTVAFENVNFNAVNFYGDVELVAVWAIGNTSLTIKADGPVDPTQTFLFTITGDKVDLEVVVPAGGSVTIDGLVIDTKYTVTLQTSWSWRYDVGGVSFKGEKMSGNPTAVEVTLDLVTQTQVENQEKPNVLTFTFAENPDNDKWLDGNASVNTGGTQNG